MGEGSLALHAAIFLFFFFPPVFLLHTVLPGRRGKNGLLLAASLIFYAFGQWQGIPILLLSAAVSYGAGALMGRAGTGKPLLVLALALQLGLLGCFKYLNFLVSILNGALALELSGAVLPLPVGISFFTFKAMAYTIDAYRSGGGEKRRFSDVLLYISFFPQITSGPITRFDQFAPQLARRHTSAEQAAKGLRRFIVGMAKKLLIAGPVAAVADSAFALGGALDVRMAWLGAIAYMVQLYIDFSGYSDMAIGMAAMFGFETPENFDYPYLAASVTDFWRRWHISLSSWFRDYLYIPLGGNRRGRARAALNKAAVFLLCGVWHGAGWTFLLWGAWHGMLSALESLGVINCRRWQKTAPGRVVSHIYALLAVCLGFVVFRAGSLTEAFAVLRAMFTGFALTPASTLALERVSPAAWCALMAGTAACLPAGPWLVRRTGELPPQARSRVTAASYAGTAALFLLCLLAAAGSGFKPFIYVQF